MTAQTPGQAAFEAWEALIAPPGKPMTWESLQGAESRDYRAAWEAAAQAAIDVFLAGDSVSAESIREALAAQEPQPAPADGMNAVERAARAMIGIPDGL